jgi:hypothetical protein
MYSGLTVPPSLLALADEVMNNDPFLLHCMSPMLALPRHSKIGDERLLSEGMCCKTIFTTRMSNIDSRTSTGAQRRFKNTVHLDSVIARSQRSKEFCNTIPP